MALPRVPTNPVLVIYPLQILEQLRKDHYFTPYNMAESQEHKGKAKKFSLEWILKFGLEVLTRNPSTSEVTSVLCLFCCTFAHKGEDAKQKRKRTMNMKHFSCPWRADNFSSHLKQQHPVNWNEYSSLSVEEKEKFFEKNESAEVVNMRSFAQPEGSMKACIIAKQKFKFIIDDDIIENLILGLLFNNPNFYTITSI